MRRSDQDRVYRANLCVEMRAVGSSVRSCKRHRPVLLIRDSVVGEHKPETSRRLSSPLPSSVGPGRFVCVLLGRHGHGARLGHEREKSSWLPAYPMHRGRKNRRAVDMTRACRPRPAAACGGVLFSELPYNGLAFCFSFFFFGKKICSRFIYFSFLPSWGNTETHFEVCHPGAETCPPLWPLARPLARRAGAPRGVGLMPRKVASACRVSVQELPHGPVIRTTRTTWSAPACEGRPRADPCLRRMDVGAGRC